MQHPFIPPRRASLALVATLVLAGVAPGAAAQSAERATVVIDVSDNAKDNATIAREVVRALEKHPSYPSKDIHAVLNAGAEADAQNDIKTGQAFHAAGIAALEAGDAMDAAEQFESAATLLEQSFAHLRDVDEYRQLLLRLGVARFQDGDPEGAKAAFGRAALFRADPTSVALGEAQGAYDEAATALDAAEKGAVLIETDPPHAEVYVNGRYRGISPATVAGLPVGKHLVAAFKPGWARKNVEVAADTAGLSEHTISLEPARRKMPFDKMRRDLAKEVDQAMGESRQGADGVDAAKALLFSEVAIVVRSTGAGAGKTIELFAFDTRSKRLLNHAKAGVDWSSKNRKGVEALVKDLLDFDYATALGGATAPTTPPPGAEGGDDEDDSIVSKWWFWTIIGVGVAGAAGGTAAAIILTSDDGGPPTTGSMAIRF